jgi:predicted nucleotide-binding protein (sugar kinase/HSP70/actin superfamily)
MESKELEKLLGDLKSKLSSLLSSLVKEKKDNSGELQNGLEEFEKFLKDLQQDFVKTLEYASRITKDEKIDKLYRRWAQKNISDLIDKLRDEGGKVAREKSLKEDFDKVIFRLMELTRLGKRSEVFYGIYRIFVARNKEIPKVLCEPFKPIYSDEIFKVMIFSFLSGIMEKGGEKHGGGEEDRAESGGEGESG